MLHFRHVEVNIAPRNQRVQHRFLPQVLALHDLISELTFADFRHLICLITCWRMPWTCCEALCNCSARVELSALFTLGRSDRKCPRLLNGCRNSPMPSPCR